MSWGEIYNTSWWGVALDTARTVKARPDFFGSQLNLLTSEQPNLVTNGDFATDSDWTLGTGWSIEDGKAVSDGSSNNDLRYETTFNPSILKIKFDVNDLTQGRVRLFVNTPAFTQLINATSNGSYETTVEVTSGANNLYFFSTNNFIGSIDNVSVQVVRADLDQIEAKKCLADWIHTTALKDLNN